MSVEAPGIFRERAVRAAVLATLAVTVSSASVLIIREVSKRRKEDKRVTEEGNNSSGDFGVIFPTAS